MTMLLVEQTGVVSQDKIILFYFALSQFLKNVNMYLQSIVKDLGQNL